MGKKARSVRRQIRLSAEELRLWSAEAKRRGYTFVGLVRAAVEKFLADKS